MISGTAGDGKEHKDNGYCRNRLVFAVESRAREVSEKLQQLPVITRRANDILRATRRDALPLSDPGVLRDLKKVLAGEQLSPILVAEGDIADGYHRVSLAYALDPYADVPLKLG